MPLSQPAPGSVKSNAQRLRTDANEVGCFRRFETENVDQHDAFAIVRFEGAKRGKEVHPLRWISWIGELVTDPWWESCRPRAPQVLEPDAARDPEQPRTHTGRSTKTYRRGASSDERVLREFLGVMAVSREPEEVRVDVLLVCAENIREIQSPSPLSLLGSERMEPSVTPSWDRTPVSPPPELG